MEEIRKQIMTARPNLRPVTIKNYMNQLNKLSHEIGLVYGHHYDRLDDNGKLMDELYLFHSNIINRSYLGFKKTKAEIEKNKKIIFSNEYRSKLIMFLGIESSYLLKANKALTQMKKVKKMLEEYFSNNN